MQIKSGTKFDNFRLESLQLPDSTNISTNLPALPMQKPNVSNNKLRRNSISLPALNNIDLEGLKKLNGTSITDVSFYRKCLS